MRSTASSKMTGKVRIMVVTRRTMNQGTMPTKIKVMMSRRRRLTQVNDPAERRVAAI